jgi:hypothetical protein
MKKPGIYCPLLKKNCIGDKCAWWVTVRGTNPQTGQDIDEAGCAMGWIPMLLIENAKVGTETGAAVESARNEAKKDAQRSQAIQIALGEALTGQRPGVQPLLGGPDGEKS